jgi:DNA invertase Pin-like site-specific DNA recombinase
MVKVGYLRVSTQEQRPDRQIDGLQGRCDRLFVETLSAVRPRRPIYDSVVQSLRPGDTLVVWDLDRAFRSVIDAVTEAERLRAKGIAFEIANLQIDTATPAGMLVYTVMSAFAEFERSTLIQRTKEGLEAARRRGKRLGRPPKLSATRLVEARTRLSTPGTTVTSIAREFGIAPLTLTRALRRSEEQPYPSPAAEQEPYT